MTVSNVDQGYINRYVSAAVKLNPKMTREQIDFALSHTIVREMGEKGKVVNREALLKDIRASKGVVPQQATGAQLQGDPPNELPKVKDPEPVVEKKARITEEVIYTGYFPPYLGEGSSLGVHLNKLLGAQNIAVQGITLVSEPRELPANNKNVVGMWVAISEDGSVGVNYRVVHGKDLIEENKLAVAMFNWLEKDKFPEDARPEGWVYVEVQLAPPAEKQDDKIALNF